MSFPVKTATRLCSSTAGRSARPDGRSPTNDFLLGGAFSPDGKTLAIANCGYNPHAIHLIDVATEKEIANLGVLRTWNGLAWAKDGKTLYVSGGIPLAHNDVLVYETGRGRRLDERRRASRSPATIPKKTAIAGLALSADGKSLFVLNNSDGKLYTLDAAEGKTLSTLAVGDHPIACTLNSDGTLLGIADLGGSEVVAVRVEDPAKPEIVSHLATGDHPNDLALSTDDRLFVSCGNADSGRCVRRGQRTADRDDPNHAQPESPLRQHARTRVAVSPDNKTLYVANADNNDVCVVDISASGKAKVKGFIPTGWYPTAVKVTPDGKKLIIGSGKGTGTGPNEVKLPINPDHPAGFVHHGHQLRGLLSFVDVPDDAKLAEYTRQVMANTPHPDSLLADGAAPADDRDPGPSRRSVSDQARSLHHQREPHLRSGVRRCGQGQRRPETLPVRAGCDAQPPRPGGSVRAAGQPLLQRRSVAGRPSLVHLRHRDRLHSALLGSGLLRQRQPERYRCRR